MEIPDQKCIIYDLGANNGDDLEYYLLKADLVVAIEANPKLADQIRSRYADAIAQDRLRVENCVLVAGSGGDFVAFHVHRQDHVLSQFPPPTDPAQYDRVELPSLGVSDLVARHGPAFYIKIDLESYDAVILRALFENQIVPPLISAESHNVDVFATLVALGGYDCFKLVEGARVESEFASYPVKTRDGPGVFTFPAHAAGPFGDDLPGNWLDANSFFRYLALRGLGWKDIHASRIHTPVLTQTESLVDYLVDERSPAALRWLVRKALYFARLVASY